MDRVAPDILLCIFEGDIQTVDIHEHPDVIHFGVDMSNPGDITTYFKERRKLDGTGEGLNPSPVEKSVQRRAGHRRDSPRRRGGRRQLRTVRRNHDRGRRESSFPPLITS